VAISEFEITHNGARHACSYEISGGNIKTLTVVTPFGAEASGLGGMPPDILARSLAEKMARRASAAEPLRPNWGTPSSAK
jgi:hypothetical protein